MGGIMGGGGGGGSQTTTQVQKADPWSEQQPYLIKGFQNAQNLFLDQPPPSYYPNSTVSPYSPETNTATQLRTLRALQGSPVQTAANNQVTDTLNGSYLYGGQGFNQAFDAASRKIMPMVNSQFEAGGRSNSGLADVAKTQALGDAFAGQYGAERDNQMKSLAFAPAIASQDYADIDQLQNAGAQQGGYQQNTLNDLVNRYNYGQNITQDQLKQYMQLIQGNYGGTTNTSSSQPLYQNQGASMLGGALGGASLASTLGASTAGAGLAGPWGLAAGAGLGLLFGGGGLF
jgi:hypothetical protein